MASTRVLIVGGGIIGAACAYELTRRGHSVTIIERGEVGFGCSYGNGGWIVPSHSLPLPKPAVLAMAGRMMLDPESPFYIKPRLNWDLLRWLTSFALHATKDHVLNGGRALTSLANASLEYYKQYTAPDPHPTRFRQLGLLHVCKTREALDAVAEEMEYLAQFDVPGRRIERDELHAMDPAFKKQVIGAVHYTAEAQTEPLNMVQAMAKSAVEQGAVVHERTELIDFERHGNRIEAVTTTKGRFKADHFVLATGSWSPALAKMLGIYLPIQPAKGYAIFLYPLDPMPIYPALLDERKVAVTPRDDSLKIVGTLELAGMDESITQRRVDVMVRGAREYYDIPVEPRVREVWRGLRPCLPDGLPAIGRAKPEAGKNLLIAAGHAMLGLTLAPGTAVIIADLIERKKPTYDPVPFDPTRF